MLPGRKVAPGEILLTRVTQLVTIGAVQETSFEHSLSRRKTVMSAGQFEITGAVLSATITLNVQVDLFPAASVAVYVTAVDPRLNTVPGVCVLASVTQLALTVGAAQVTAFEHSDADSVTEMFDGHDEIMGSVLSVMTTLNVHVDLCPAASVAVYVTGVVPKEKDDPEA